MHHGIHQVRLLIDPGSELSFISENTVRQLHINRDESRLPIHGIGGDKVTTTRGVVSFTLCSILKSNSINIKAHVLSTLTSTLPSFETQRVTWKHIEPLQLADPDFLVPRSIDVIIGADNYGLVIKPNIIKGSNTMPIAQLSIFGWLVHGPVNQREAMDASVFHASVHQDNEALQNQLTKFWMQEELPSICSYASEDQKVEEHFLNTHMRDENGRYILRIPLKSSVKSLGQSYRTAHLCLQRTLQKLKKNSDYGKLYMDFMKEYEKLGHMERAPSLHSKDSVIYYLPHHGVLRPDKETTKLRVVFNGSSATSSGLSVNDIMHTGPNLLLNITDVLIWIRHHQQLFATDVTKMYRQVGIHQKDWDLQRILWVDEQFNEIPYRLTTVTYGTRAAPFLACRALLQLAKDEGNRFPLAISSITKGRYVDDIFGGADTTEDLIETATQLKNLCAAGCLPLAKWYSTNMELLQSVASEEVTKREITFDDCSPKILGMKWLIKKDKFVFTSKCSTPSDTITKRTILSEVAQIFDPLGFVSPVVIRAKTLLQELWICKLGWDDPLPEEISTRWLIIREDLNSLARLSIPRWFGTWKTSSVNIHGFSDASQLAMAAVVYITVETPSTRSEAVLVCSKTRVAPLKPLTINRLELSAAVMLAQLVTYVRTTLTVTINQVHLWTDSTCTLLWIQSHPSRWKEYVKNRVSKVQELTSECHWRHVPGVCNPADCASRGVSTDQLQSHSLWWSGPSWISQSSEYWPKQPDLDKKTTISEEKQGRPLLLATIIAEYHWDLINRCESLHKLIRLTAICFRVFSLRHFSAANFDIDTACYQKARLFWVKVTQAMFFASELKMMQQGEKFASHHSFSRLTAYLDDNGVLRVGGRLEATSLTYENKHPAILPRDSRLTSLVIAQSHQLTMHGGTQSTLAHLRQLYWIIGGRAAVKSCVMNCVMCARQRGIRAHQLMGQLPFCRVTPSRPFTHTGVDYAGPVTIKTWKGRGAKTTKGWICVFVCFSTSAVHLESVSDYTTDGFIASYRRFTGRRGIPLTLYSDCGTNFVGAEKTLKQLFRQGSRENQDLAMLFSRDQTGWKFNPPAAPHMGGKWESVVKSTKYHLRRTIGDHLLTFEELSTLLIQIEAILNSRPLEPLSDDPSDVSALTPGHFLIGGPLSAIPETTLTDLVIPPMKRWLFVQQRVHQFWSQWSKYYLQRQQAISKWHHPMHNITVGSLVLLTDERYPPCKWPLARVTEVHPGKDGLVRVVSLKTATTTLTRPISKLCILPVHGSEHQDNPSNQGQHHD